MLDFDSDAAAKAGEIRADLERQGARIGAYDVLIAGHSRSRGLIVITGNPGEFGRVESVRCQDWKLPKQISNADDRQGRSIILRLNLRGKGMPMSACDP